MARYNKPTSDGPSCEDKALDLFAEMMIEKIQSIDKDWKKPWFTDGALQWPKNLNTRVRDKDCVKNRVKRAKIVRFTLC